MVLKLPLVQKIIVTLPPKKRKLLWKREKIFSSAIHGVIYNKSLPSAMNSCNNQKLCHKNHLIAG